MFDLTASHAPAGATDFLRIFNRLCVALREPQDDSGVKADVYFDALKDLPLKSLEDGAGRIIREPGRKWFPTTAEWRGAALEAQELAFRAAVQPATREKPWVDECEACNDTGWAYQFCPGDVSCRRPRTHAAHDYVRVCSCLPNNRTFQRHAHFGAGR